MDELQTKYLTVEILKAIWIKIENTTEKFENSTILVIFISYLLNNLNISTVISK